MVTDDESQQIEIRELTGAVDPGVIGDPRIKKAQVVGPELVMPGRGGFRQSFYDCSDRQWIGIAGVGHDPHASVLRDGTRGPAAASIPGEPLACSVVHRMVLIEKRDEHIDVEECAHQ
jgi:hypothetical protein